MKRPAPARAVRSFCSGGDLVALSGGPGGGLLAARFGRFPTAFFAGFTVPDEERAALRRLSHLAISSRSLPRMLGPTSKAFGNVGSVLAMRSTVDRETPPIISHWAGIRP